MALELNSRERTALTRVAALLREAQELVDSETRTHSLTFDLLDRDLNEQALRVEKLLAEDAALTEALARELAPLAGA